MSLAGGLRFAHPPYDLAHHSPDKTGPFIGVALAAGFQHVSEQKAPGNFEAVLQVSVGQAALTFLALAHERRKAQEFVAPWLTGRTRNGVAGFR